MGLICCISYFLSCLFFLFHYLKCSLHTYCYWKLYTLWWIYRVRYIRLYASFAYASLWDWLWNLYCNKRLQLIMKDGKCHNHSKINLKGQDLILTTLVGCIFHYSHGKISIYIFIFIWYISVFTCIIVSCVTVVSEDSYATANWIIAELKNSLQVSMKLKILAWKDFWYNTLLKDLSSVLSWISWTRFMLNFMQLSHFTTVW